jgi:hypothetical protein
MEAEAEQKLLEKEAERAQEFAKKKRKNKKNKTTAEKKKAAPKRKIKKVKRKKNATSPQGENITLTYCYILF